MISRVRTGTAMVAVPAGRPRVIRSMLRRSSVESFAYALR
ncbi:hypothetical protein FHS63_001300 [Azospirillum doebereinerae]